MPHAGWRRKVLAARAWSGRRPDRPGFPRLRQDLDEVAGQADRSDHEGREDTDRHPGLPVHVGMKFALELGHVDPDLAFEVRASDVDLLSVRSDMSVLSSDTSDFKFVTSVLRVAMSASMWRMSERISATFSKASMKRSSNVAGWGVTGFPIWAISALVHRGIMPCDRCPSTAVFSAMRVRFRPLSTRATILRRRCRGGGRHRLAALIQRDGSVPAQKDLQPDFDACHALAKIPLVPGEGVHLAAWPRVYIQRPNHLPDQTRERSDDSENTYKLRTHSPVAPCCPPSAPCRAHGADKCICIDLTPNDRAIRQSRDKSPMAIRILLTERGPRGPRDAGRTGFPG